MGAVSIGRLAKHRFFTPNDIDGSGLTQASAQAQILQSIIQNTLEQSLLASITYLVWAVLIPGPFSIYCLYDWTYTVHYWIWLWCTSKGFRIYLIILRNKWNVGLSNIFHAKQSILTSLVSCKISDYIFV